MGCSKRGNRFHPPWLVDLGIQIVTHGRFFQVARCDDLIADIRLEMVGMARAARLPVPRQAFHGAGGSEEFFVESPVAPLASCRAPEVSDFDDLLRLSHFLCESCLAA